MSNNDPIVSNVELTNPAAEQTANVAGDVSVYPQTIISPEVTDTANSSQKNTIPSSEIIPTATVVTTAPVAFNNQPEDKPLGDALPQPFNGEIAPAAIVAAQAEHLANLYETSVESVVFITANTQMGVGSGSGFVWDTEGHLVTNYHVIQTAIQNASSLTVKFFNGREYRAEVVAWDPDSDLAVIKINDIDHELIPLPMGNSSTTRPGEMAIALGNPFGEEFTMTTGIVSAVTRTLSNGFSSYSIPAVMQTDAAINPGNSGGPLLDMNGAVIGINTQIKSSSRQSSGVGFAVPVDLVKRVVPSLINDGQHSYSLMGISGNEVNILLRERANLPNDILGAYVNRTTAGGPADIAGIQSDSSLTGSLNFDGDVIVSINSIPMKSMDDLIGYLALNTEPGDEITVGVFRDGEEIAIPMTLGARPSTS
ncbi:MAG: trypsin-like peptidase domain-containing protein [Chloroflexota bacterium]|nr:trypsin-like peptidase domain-containing protein [Chloroflexota bacterium]